MTSTAISLSATDHTPVVAWWHKGFAPQLEGVAVRDLAEHGHPALGEAAATPLALLRGPALHHNLAAMRDFCRASGVDLAPHGKTTLSPQLISLQLQHSAWAITAATPWQARVLRQHRVPRILLAKPRGSGGRGGHRATPLLVMPGWPSA